VRTTPGSRYDTDDGVLAGEVARRAALALDNARLYRDAQEAIQLRDQFLSIAAHELKTPLTTLLGTAQLLQRRDQRDNVLAPRERRGVEIIVNQAMRLNTMILALLDISRLEAGQLTIEREPLELADILRRLVGEVEASLEGRAIELELPAEPLALMGDPLRLEQVFQNLIQNALKYSNPPEPIAVRARRDDGCVVVTVQDRGIGIPQAALSQLFQRFYRASNAKDTHVAGMGIGLYVVREIVALHGGEITVASTEGVGSTFTVTLPLAASDE
jgi:signal transduction histidine kinase